MNYIQHPYPAVYWTQVALMCIALAGVAVAAWWSVASLRREMREATKTESTAAGKHKQSIR